MSSEARCSWPLRSALFHYPSHASPSHLHTHPSLLLRICRTIHLFCPAPCRHEKVQENCIDLVGRIADRGAEFVPAREWMRICFELLDMLKVGGW